HTESVQHEHTLKFIVSSLYENSQHELHIYRVNLSSLVPSDRALPALPRRRLLLWRLTRASTRRPAFVPPPANAIRCRPALPALRARSGRARAASRIPASPARKNRR